MQDNLLQEALKQRILPAVTFSKEREVLPVAEAILKGGLQVMEVTFRTDLAAGAVTLLRKNFPEMYIGAGTLLSVLQVKQAMEAGAQFGLAPAFNPSVCQQTKKVGFPFIPGVMTPSEIEKAAEMDFRILKLFPAAQMGGVGFLKALQTTYTLMETKFIPMGGVSADNMKQYLEMKNVIAVGGTWLTAGESDDPGQFEKITGRVKDALTKTQ